MKVFFSAKDTANIVERLKEAAIEHGVADLVSFAIEGAQLTVSVSRMGTSQLIFTGRECDGGIEYTMTGEKIAMMHRTLAGEVKKKFREVLTGIGGKVLA
jgi:hypothetical protein